MMNKPADENVIYRIIRVFHELHEVGNIAKKGLHGEE